MTPNTKFACKRCGNCCEQLGPGWFRLSDHPLIKAFAEVLFLCEREPLPDEGGCAMLIYEDGGCGKAVCLIHKYLGWRAKPEVCRQFRGEDAVYKCEGRDNA